MPVLSPLPVADSTQRLSPPPVEPVRHFLERHWREVLGGAVIEASLGEVEDPGDRFEWFTGDDHSGAVARYRMPLRDGSRICATVNRRIGRVSFWRDRHDPAAGVGSLVRYAFFESALAKTCLAAIAALRAPS